MSRFSRLIFALFAAVFGALLPIVVSKTSRSGSVTIDSHAIMQAASLSDADIGSYLAQYSGAAPTRIRIPEGATSVSFSVSGQIYICTGGTCPVDLDGYGTGIPCTCSGSNGIAGITSSAIGFLTGLFVNGDRNSSSMMMPPSLDYSQGGTTLHVHAPERNMPFFVGDGLTGTGAGQVQVFKVPAGSTRLYLGISDCFSGMIAAVDNSGQLNVDYEFNIRHEKNLHGR